MSNKWLWVAIAAVVAGLVLQVGCVPPTSPEEKRRREVRAAHQLPKQQEWLSNLQATVPEIKKQSGIDCSFEADFSDGDFPIVTVECQGLTKREAVEIADTIAGSYLGTFPDTTYLSVFVKDWDSLEQIYLGSYRGEQ